MIYVHMRVVRRCMSSIQEQSIAPKHCKMVAQAGALTALPLEPL